MKLAGIKKLRIAWFTPLEALGSGQTFFSKSAYASSLVLPLLQESCEVELFSARGGQILGDMVSRHYLTASQQHQQKPFDLFFYNLENGKHAEFCRLHLALMPGLLWAHDFTLIDDGPEPILNSPWTKMIEIFNQTENLQAHAWPVKKDQFIPKRPQALREVGMSFACLFSAERDLEQYRQMNPLRINSEDRGMYLPLPVDYKNLFFQENTEKSKILRVITCAHPNVESHIHTLLQAISNRKDIELRWLVDTSEVPKCRELIAEFNLESVVVHEGRTPESWVQLLKDSDLAIHMLYTFYQQSNPWLSLSLSQGVFSAVLDFSESDYLPQDVAIRITPGFSEVSQLCVVFDQLSARNIFRNNQAFEYAKERFDAKVVTAELISMFHSLHPNIIEFQKRFALFSKLGRDNLFAQNEIIGEPEHSKIISEIFSELGWI